MFALDPVSTYIKDSYVYNGDMFELGYLHEMLNQQLKFYWIFLSKLRFECLKSNFVLIDLIVNVSVKLKKEPRKYKYFMSIKYKILSINNVYLLSRTIIFLLEKSWSKDE